MYRILVALIPAMFWGHDSQVDPSASGPTGNYVRILVVGMPADLALLWA